MQLAKAKEIILLNINEAGTKMPPDVKKALIIACESIEAIQLYRQIHSERAIALLPGETTR